MSLDFMELSGTLWGIELVGLAWGEKSRSHSTNRKNTYYINAPLWRLWAEIEAHKWRDLELNLSKTVEELSQDFRWRLGPWLIVCIQFCFISVP